MRYTGCLTIAALVLSVCPQKASALDAREIFKVAVCEFECHCVPGGAESENRGSAVGE